MILRSATRTAESPLGTPPPGVALPRVVGAAHAPEDVVEVPAAPAPLPPPTASEPARKREKPAIDLGDPWPAAKPQEGK